MEISEAQQTAMQTYMMRDMGIALVTASCILGLFLFIPLTQVQPENETPTDVVAATPTAPDAFAKVPIEATAAIVYDLATGEVLYEKNADAQLPLASLTKLLAVYAALTQFPHNAPITISSDAARLEAPRAFNEGQVLALDDLSRLTLTASLNDGAAAIIEATAERENVSQRETLARAASELSLSQTYAVNGNGLDVSTAVSGGYGSARDMARLAGALVAQAPVVAAATTEEFAKARSHGGTLFSVKNTDPIVGTIPRLLLSKTGFTDLAGGNLALVFDVGINHPVAIVVLGSTKVARFTDSTELLAATFAHFAGVAPL